MREEIEMSVSQNRSVPDVADRHRRLLAYALVAVGLIVPILVWKMRNASTADGHLYKNEDGFVARSPVAERRR